MKRFFANVIVVVSVILTGFVAFPMTTDSLNFYGLGIPFLIDNELLIKGAIGALMVVLSLIYLIIGCVEYKHNQEVTPSTANAAFVPVFSFAIFALFYALLLAIYHIAWVENPMATLPIEFYTVVGLAVLIVNLILIGHLISVNMREKGNAQRILLYILVIEIMLASGAAGYYLFTTWTAVDYAGLNYEYYIAFPIISLAFYIAHIIIIHNKTEKQGRFDGLDDEIKSMRPAPKDEERNEPKSEEKMDVEPLEAPKPVKLSKAEKQQMQQEQIQSAKGKKTTIVSKDQAIISGEMSVDPTNLLYEEVSIDPEFNKTSNMDKQVSSIEYYIEKPKMFKPLDPTFDALVAYVRELPNVVTKISDERITFYVDRKPFLVLMNFGNYYRMAFRSDLEKGVRLIIKYPTISKNKGTKESLWFKANNYGDLPKEVIYDIVKSAFDNVNA
jgi:hypothetical protein